MLEPGMNSKLLETQCHCPQGSEFYFTKTVYHCTSGRTICCWLCFPSTWTPLCTIYLSLSLPVILPMYSPYSYIDILAFSSLSLPPKPPSPLPLLSFSVNSITLSTRSCWSIGSSLEISFLIIHV